MNMLVALVSIVLVYFVFSVACSAIAEGLARIKELRGRALKADVTPHH